jgi:hypothetical protein
VTDNEERLLEPGTSPGRAMRLRFDSLDELTDDDAATFASGLVADATGGAATVSAAVTEASRPAGVGDMPAIVTEITVVVGQLGLVAYVVAAVRDKFRRGVVVDATGEDLVVRPDRRLPLGSVVLVSDDNTNLSLDRDVDLPSVLPDLLTRKR